MALIIRALAPEDDRSAFHLSDRPEPTPMFLEIGAIPKSKAAR